jgi:hypothetical protein
MKEGLLMAQENVKLFTEKLASSDELKKRCRELEAAYTGDKQDREAAANAVLIPLSKEAGLPFTLEELKAEEATDCSLSDEDLAKVSGGTGGFCFIGGGGDGIICAVIGFDDNGMACVFFSISADY